MIDVRYEDDRLNRMCNLIDKILDEYKILEVHVIYAGGGPGGYDIVGRYFIPEDKETIRRSSSTKLTERGQFKRSTNDKRALLRKQFEEGKLTLVEYQTQFAKLGVTR